MPRPQLPPIPSLPVNIRPPLVSIRPPSFTQLNDVFLYAPTPNSSILDAWVSTPYGNQNYNNLPASASSSYHFNRAINTLGGNDKVYIDLSANSTSHLTVNLGTGHDVFWLRDFTNLSTTSLPASAHTINNYTSQSTKASVNLDAGAGDDVVYTSAGNDLVSGGQGNDYLDTGSGNDTVDGGTGNDIIKFIHGGADNILGGTGDDHIFIQGTKSQNFGTTMVNGGDGNDWIAFQPFTGNQPPDLGYFFNGSTTLNGGNGNDTIHTYGDISTGQVNIWGGNGNDTMDLNATGKHILNYSFSDRGFLDEVEHFDAGGLAQDIEKIVFHNNGQNVFTQILIHNSFNAMGLASSQTAGTVHVVKSGDEFDVYHDWWLPETSNVARAHMISVSEVDLHSNLTISGNFAII